MTTGHITADHDISMVSSPTAQTYNGWANRETWVWNLHAGDEILVNLLELADDGYFDDADSEQDIRSYLEAYSENYLDEILEYSITGSAASLIQDLLGDHNIDHAEMADHWFDDVMDKLKEGLEGLEPDDLPCWAKAPSA